MFGFIGNLISRVAPYLPQTTYGLSPSFVSGLASGFSIAALVALGAYNVYNAFYGINADPQKDTDAKTPSGGSPFREEAADHTPATTTDTPTTSSAAEQPSNNSNENELALNNLRTAHNQLVANHQATQQLVSTLQRQIHDLNEAHLNEVLRYRNSHREISYKHQSLAEQVTQLENENDALKSRNSGSREALANLNKELEEQKATLAEQENEILKLNSQINSLSGQRNSLTESNRQLHQDNQGLETDLSNQADTIRSLQLEVGRLTDRIATLLANAAETENDLKAIQNLVEEQGIDMSTFLAQAHSSPMQAKGNTHH